MNFTLLHHILPYQLQGFPLDTCLNWKDGKNWKSLSTKSVLNGIGGIRKGIQKLGLKKGDRLAMFSSIMHPYWIMVDQACMSEGIIVVSIAPSYSDEELKAIFTDCSPKAILCANSEDTARYIQLGYGFRGVIQFSDMDNPSSSSELSSNEDASIELENYINRWVAEGEEIFDSVDLTENDVCTIIYTSGTTGNPKGVMLTHANIVSNIKSCLAVMPLEPKQRALSFLPLYHILERMVVYCYLSAGMPIYFANPHTNLLGQMAEVKPHFFTCVPKFLERIHHAMLRKAETMGGFRKRILNWALGLGYLTKEDWITMPLRQTKRFIADILVYRVLRKKLGGKVQGILCGSARLDPRLARLVNFARIPLREGYGLTETSPVISLNKFEAGGNKFGTVGMPLAGVKVKIENPDELGFGEVQVKGPNVMKGYYKDSITTEQVFTTDGWFKTGDRGRLNHRFLEVNGRIKDSFKTSAGKFVIPQRLESILCTSPYIQQVMIVGDGRSYAGALIVPEFESLKLWCQHRNIHWTSPAYMVHNPKIEEFYRETIAVLNDELEGYEKVRTFSVLPFEWTMEASELTSTLKVKRAFLMKKFQKEIEEMYLKNPIGQKSTLNEKPISGGFSESFS
jgi:long-chain acyl-CoA synthetase